MSHIRAIWRRLSHDGHFVFFDVQPIAVKAYGGRRYTTELRPVLESKQKTRGMFYLFTAYSATTGRVYWSFMSGKSSRFVCRFFRKLRRHIPKSELWVILDRDPAHPIKSKMTRRLFRRLKIHWVSLPKRCPDDNPVENIFSNIQLMILDNSDDSTPADTQRRITNHFRGRNRRKDRWIKISYLENHSTEK